MESRKEGSEGITIGEQRIGIVFKKGNNDKVHNLKEHFAHLINVVDKTKNEKNGREVALAMTEIENASHWAVKSLFK